MRSKILPIQVDHEVRSIIARAVNLQAPETPQLTPERIVELTRVYPAFGRLGELLALADDLRRP